MTVKLTQADFQNLTRTLYTLPEFALARERYRLVSSALAGVDQAQTILARIDFDGSAQGVAIEVVRLLCSFGQVAPGKEALGAFLEQLLTNTGGGDAADLISDLISQYKLNPPPAAPSDSLPGPTRRLSLDNCYVFISYAHADKAYAEQVEQYLHAANVRSFRDSSGIASGANWDMTIEQALRETSCMVLLLSQTSMPYRKEVHREWFFFDQERKPIYPLLIQPCTLHSRLLAYNYIDAGADLYGALEKLLATLADQPPTSDHG